MKSQKLTLFARSGWTAAESPTWSRPTCRWVDRFNDDLDHDLDPDLDLDHDIDFGEEDNDTELSVDMS